MGPGGPRHLRLPLSRPGALDRVVYRTLQVAGGGTHLHLGLAVPLAQPLHLPAGPVKLWVAQGFGVGRVPVAPGTFGSVVGVLWFGLLLMTGNLWLFVAGTIAAVALSVWLCGAAERAPVSYTHLTLPTKRIV